MVSVSPPPPSLSFQLTSGLVAGLTAYSVSERVLISDSRPKPTLFDSMKGIWTSFHTLRTDIKLLCFIQFFAWCAAPRPLLFPRHRPALNDMRGLFRIGWFPTMFFTAVWVSDLYVKHATSALGRAATDPLLFDEATRAGARAMFFQALVAFLTACALPFLVAPADPPPDEVGWRERPGGDGWRAGMRERIESLGLKMEWIPQVPFKWLSLPLVWVV